jgi:hypothetical protein
LSSGDEAPKYKPADLRDDLYVRSFALLEPDEYWCGRREVWTATHGRARRYHVMVDDGVAACRSKLPTWHNRSVILLTALIPIGEVPQSLCCLRNGCRQCFDAYLA